MPVKIKSVNTPAWNGRGEGCHKAPTSIEASDNWWLPREEESAFFKGSKWLTKLQWIAAQTPRNPNTHSTTEPHLHPFPFLSRYMVFAGLVPLPSASRAAGIRKHRLPKTSLKNTTSISSKPTHMGNKTKSKLHTNSQNSYVPYNMLLRL